MAKLPAWVKIVLTGRPQMEKSFQPWKPYLAKIEPQSSENMEDLRIVLKARLEQDGRIVSTEDVPAAVDVLLKKSEGDMIYTKYAFDLLCGKKGRWTIAEMEDEEALPSRLDGMFRAFMGELQDALQEEQPDTLNLLRQQLLPILVAAKSPLSSQQLAVMTGAEQHQVDQLLGLLSNMFPLQERRRTLRVVPYHKSVLDWLTNPTRSKDLFVDAKKGDQILGKACFNAVKAAGASASVPSDGSILQSCAGSQPSGCILEYALHFGVTHFCHVHSRSECLECLEALILDFCGFWPMAFELGFGAELLKNLIALGPKTSTVVKDVVRWLRLTNGYLSTYPRAALQLACDAPHESMVAQKANSLPQKPPGKLLTKEHHWSACLNVMKEGVPNVCSVAVSGETIVSGSPYDKTIRVFDLESGECKKTLTGHTQAAPSVAISSGACVVSGSSDRTLKVWDLESGDCQKTLSGHDDAVIQVVISPDARLCASCSYDGTARVWDLADGACKRVLEHHRKMYFGASLQFLPIIVSCVAIHAEAHLCVSGSEDCNVRIWDLVDGSCKNMFREHGGAVRTVAISSDAHLCVSGSMDKTIRVWNLETGACQKTLSGHTGAVVCVAISPDTRLCASGSLDSTIRVWELESGVCVKTLSGHTAGMSVAFTTDACIVSGSADCTIRVWDLVGETREAPPPGHTDTVLNVQSSPDGSSCMSCSDDGTLRCVPGHLIN
ncbi:quinon protein alcohol dehydrogenase-like superfamily [Dunaliella salina]|uniref:Quinon protein alcohol dehydrogenase-like superfamily n=1 Tax=Dunaliella salina TaxID=3046 RepID=A0ABQ7H830_DUNSA|nr:quinon protein alcohol dehydrogenase-like superfamily [Dunaliella salina]|eukprot:KAF5843008.1 quinon protein alcohol dehydrogenase-like superfamily [Dunaliella salina]